MAQNYTAQRLARKARRAVTRKWRCYSGHGKRIFRGSDEELDAERTNSSYCKKCADTVAGYWSR